MSNADYRIPFLPNAHRGKTTIFHLRNLSGSSGNGSFDLPVCLEQTRVFFWFFVFLQSRVDRLSSEWWNKWWDGSQTHRAASVGNRRVKVFGSFSCRVLSMTRPSWTCTIIDRVFCIRCQVLIDLSYSPPWLEVFELLLRVVRLPSENTCSGLINSQTPKTYWTFAVYMDIDCLWFESACMFTGFFKSCFKSVYIQVHYFRMLTDQQTNHQIYPYPECSSTENHYGPKKRL